MTLGPLEILIIIGVPVLIIYGIVRLVKYLIDYAKRP